MCNTARKCKQALRALLEDKIDDSNDYPQLAFDCIRCSETGCSSCYSALFIYGAIVDRVWSCDNPRIASIGLNLLFKKRIEPRVVTRDFARILDCYYHRKCRACFEFLSLFTYLSAAPFPKNPLEERLAQNIDKLSNEWADDSEPAEGWTLPIRETQRTYPRFHGETKVEPKDDLL